MNVRYSEPNSSADVRLGSGQDLCVDLLPRCFRSKGQRNGEQLISSHKVPILLQ